MAIPPGVTPTITFSLPEGYDISNAAHVYVALQSSRVKVFYKSDDELTITDGRYITMALTQEDTLKFQNDSTVKAQINWVYSDGTRGATKVATFNMDEQLMRWVLP